MNVGQRLQQRFRKALRDYRLIEDGDKILVGLSGGKDSLCLLELLAQQSKVFFPKFTVEALHVRMENIQYETDTTYLRQFCDSLDVPLHIITTHFETEKAGKKSKPACFLCSWQRRKQLFNLAQELGCNKIALGHHQDDIIHTALMNLTFQGHFSSMPPLLKMEKMPLSIIRPLCLCEEGDIIAYAGQQGYEKQLKTCPYEHDTNRTTVKELFGKMQQLNSGARYSIWNALEEGNRLVQRLTVCILLLLAMTVSAQRRHRVTQKKTPPQEQTAGLSEELQEMIQATQRIMFIDSVVVPKADFLSAFHLTSEVGRIAPHSTFFPKSTSSAVTYINALSNMCIYPSQNDSDLVARECLLQQWMKTDTLQGINQERKLHHIRYPFMMPDGITLYFAAEGEGSIGGCDIFMTTYDPSEGQFLTPKNIGMPFNSTANDYMLAIDEYNNLGFFASDRNQPDSMVCVYTFIPAEKYQTYDTGQYTPEQISAFARIDSISMTWDDEHLLQEAVKRLEQAKRISSTPKPAFSFVINDQVTYHHVKDFQTTDNQKRFQKLLGLKQRHHEVVVSLEKARNYYTKADANERDMLAREILSQEQTQHELYQAIHQQEKIIRQAENNHLNNKPYDEESFSSIRTDYQ